jgi:multidrug efflux system membrane fusion protein
MCVMVGQTGPYVFKVNADDTVALQPVTLGQRRSDFAVVTKGVSAGDRIITAGQLGLVTGKKVTPTLWQPPAPLPSRQDAAK